MNISENTMLITLAFVMIALIFSVIALSATAEVPLGSPARISVHKETVPFDAVYEVGDPIEYTIRLRNPGDYNATVYVWDVLPNGTMIDYPWPNPSQNPVYFPADSEVRWWNFKTTVADDWDPDNTGRITNIVVVRGFDDNPDFPGGDIIDFWVTCSSNLIYEPSEVPVLTPLGMITLLGLLSGIAVIALRKRQ